jgi:hypothetical protein
MPAPIRIQFEIDGEFFRDDASPAVLQMRRAVARGLRERWPRERILETVLAIGRFEGVADLAQGVSIINQRENYYWTLTLRLDSKQFARSQSSKAIRLNSRR